MNSPEFLWDLLGFVTHGAGEGDTVQGRTVECGQNVHLARGLIFASVLKVFEGVGAIWEGPDGGPPGSQGGPRPPPQNTTISLRQGAFGV